MTDHRENPRNGSDRRRFKRATTIFNGSLYLAAERYDSLVLDVSVTGVKVKAQSDIPLGSPVTLALAEKVNFGGEVVWNDGKTVGVRFTKTPEKVAGIMAGLLPHSYLEAKRAA